MKYHYLAAFALLALSHTLPALSQSDTETANQPPAQAAQDPDVSTERYRDWALTCRTNAESGQRQCSMFQRLVVQDTNQVALNVAIGFLQSEEGARVPVAVFTFPLGIFLPAGAELQVDDTEPTQLQIERCFQRGCQSGLALDDKRLAQFRAGSSANVTVMQSREQSIDLTVSLSGFSAAFDALSASNTGGS